jgi:hypothetical protein
MKKRKSYNHPCNDDTINDRSSVSKNDTHSQKKPKKNMNRFDSVNDTKLLSSDQQQHAKTISITKSDHDKILQLLQSIDWDMAKNTSRRNVIRQDDPNTPKLNKGSNNSNGKPYCQSFIFGRNMKDPEQSLSYWSIQYPNIYQEFQNLIQKYNHTQFTYTHITVNKNLQCKRHTDGGNAGLSYIIGFGNYTGGELQIEEEVSSVSSSSHHTTKTKTTNINTKIYNLYRTFVLFNGKLQPHETLPFHGERYTIVYYTSDIVPKVYHHHDTNIPTTTPTTAIGDNPNNDGNTHPSSLTTNNSQSNKSTSTTTNGTIQVSDTLTAKFNAMKKKLGRKR